VVSPTTVGGVWGGVWVAVTAGAPSRSEAEPSEDLLYGRLRWPAHPATRCLSATSPMPRRTTTTNTQSTLIMSRHNGAGASCLALPCPSDDFSSRPLRLLTSRPGTRARTLTRSLVRRSAFRLGWDVVWGHARAMPEPLRRPVGLADLLPVFAGIRAALAQPAPTPRSKSFANVRHVSSITRELQVDSTTG
jgi:hypothetical protein